MSYVRQTREQMRDELAQLREAVSCIVVLEQAGFQIDRKESSRRHMKFRRGEGEIVIVTHEGHGWWSPASSDARGAVLDLILFINPGWAFGDAVKELRRVSGIAPTYTPYQRSPKDDGPRRDQRQMWQGLAALEPGSRSWGYLAHTRKLPDWILVRAAAQDVIRAGYKGTACFVHKKNDGMLSGMEMRGPEYRGFSKDGDKYLFRFQTGRTGGPIWRLVICEAAIDALSYAALDGEMLRSGTLYVSTAGGMSPESFAEIERLMGSVSASGVIVAATDADPQGDRFANAYETVAQAMGRRFVRHRPVEAHGDWNTTLQSLKVIPKWDWPFLSEARAFTTMDLDQVQAS